MKSPDVHVPLTPFSSRMEGSTHSASPGVTVLLPVYNGEAYLREAVDSVLRQTYPDFELLVIDDGSTDGTPDILRSYEDPRLRVVRNEVNQGLARTLNRGLQLARGEYVARQDADDVWEPELLAVQVAFLDRNPDIAMVGCAFREIDQHGTPGRTRTLPCSPDEIHWDLHFHNTFIHSGVTIRREVLLRAGGYNENCAYGEDYELWLRLARTHRLANLKTVLARVRTTSTGMRATHPDRERVPRELSCRAIAGLAGWQDNDPGSHERILRMWALYVVRARPLTPAEASRAASDVMALHDRYCALQGISGARKALLRYRLRRRLGRHLIEQAVAAQRRREPGNARRLLWSALRIRPWLVVMPQRAPTIAAILAGR